MEKKTNKCYKVIRWKNYNLSAWTNKREDGSMWLNYEIQRSVFLGKDKEGNKNWSNQALSITKLEDLCYLKTLIRYMIPKLNNKPLQKFSFVSIKIFDEDEKKQWKDKDKPTKEELKKSLKLIHFFRKYTDKDKKVQETKRFILNVSELDIFRDFVEYSISQINDIYDKFEKFVYKKENPSKYKDNIDYSQENKEEFIDEKLNDDIPF